jgi:hypothetical protein
MNIMPFIRFSEISYNMGVIISDLLACKMRMNSTQHKSTNIYVSIRMKRRKKKTF